MHGVRVPMWQLQTVRRYVWEDTVHICEKKKQILAYTTITMLLCKMDHHRPCVTTVLPTNSQTRPSSSLHPLDILDKSGFPAIYSKQWHFTIMNTFIRTKQHKKKKKEQHQKTAIYSLDYIYIKHGTAPSYSQYQLLNCSLKVVIN